MKIRVEYRDGRRETITVEGVMRIVEEGEWLDHIVTSGGGYLFTKDGYYEGRVGRAPDPQRAQGVVKEGQGREAPVLVVRQLSFKIH